MSPPVSEIRLNSLTGLRFIAALIVVLYHISAFVLPEIGPFIVLGYTGVAFFFVLSGFVLAWSFRPTTSKRVFYWRRFARIWPLHALTTLLAAAYLSVNDGAVSLERLPAVLLLVQAWNQEWANAFNGVSWSLSAEAFFYLCFPLLAAWLSRYNVKAVLGAAAAVFGTAAVAYWVLFTFWTAVPWGDLLYILPAFRMVDFTIGVCLAFAFRRGWRPRFGATTGALIAGGSFVLLEAVVPMVPEIFRPETATLLMMPGIAALVAGFAKRDLAGGTGLSSTPVMVRLGEWSFSLYLIHELVIRVALMLHPLRLHQRVGISFGVLVVSIALSALLYQLVERPLEKRLRPLVAMRKADAGGGGQGAVPDQRETVARL